jgi:hypothetical protein
MYCTLCCSLIINTSDTPDLGFNHVECPRCIFPSFLQCFSTNKHRLCHKLPHRLCPLCRSPVRSSSSVRARSKERGHSLEGASAMGYHGMPSDATDQVQHAQHNTESHSLWSAVSLGHPRSFCSTSETTLCYPCKGRIEETLMNSGHESGYTDCDLK